MISLLAALCTYAGENRSGNGEHVRDRTNTGEKNEQNLRCLASNM